MQRNDDLIYPDDDQIEPDLARFLYEEHCAFLLLENLPSGSEFGIDLTCYEVGPDFKGVKLIPPGLHFIYAGALDVRNNQHGPRTGFFHYFKPKEFLLKRWSQRDEEFDDSFDPSEELCDRYKSNLRNLDRFLGVYKFSTYKTYLGLTSKISQYYAYKLSPVIGKIRSIPYLISKHGTRGPPSNGACNSSRLTCQSSTDGSNLLPNLQPDPSTVIQFTYIPKTYKDANYTISPNQITQYQLDSSLKLEHGFGATESGIESLLAEFQYAFLVFISCHVYECFEHWKILLSLVCLSEASLKRPEMYTLYSQFMSTFYLQIEYIPSDLFLDIDQRNNLVRHHLDIFFQNIKDNSELDHIKSSIKPQADQLQAYLEKKFCWQFEMPVEDEDEPVVVKE